MSDFAIDTPRLALRRFTPDDIDFLTLLLGEQETMSHWEAPLTRTEAASWLQRALQSYAADGLGRLLVLRKDHSQPIGDVGIQKLSMPDKHGNLQWENDLGYIIHRDHWGHGFGLEAASACVDWASGHGLESVVATMAQDNLASIRTAERLGMNLERKFNNPRNRGKTTRFYRLEFAGQDLPAGDL